jgi:hypothetical protein
MTIIENISISSNQLIINYKGDSPAPALYSCSKDDGFCYEDPNGKMSAEECNKSNGCGGGRRSCNISEGSQSVNTKNTLTWYGSTDNCPPGTSIDSQPGGGVAGAGGIGTWDDPLTMAYTKHVELKHGDCIYVHEFKKYFIYEDTCEECKKGHYDLWMGPSNISGVAANNLIDCEVQMTRSNAHIINNPPDNLEVDQTPIFDENRANNSGCYEHAPPQICKKVGTKWNCGGGDDGEKLLCGNTCQIPCKLTDSGSDSCKNNNIDWIYTEGGKAALAAAQKRGDNKWRCEDLASLVGMTYDDFVRLNGTEEPLEPSSTHPPLNCPKTPCGSNCGDSLYDEDMTFCMGDCCGHVINIPK